MATTSNSSVSFEETDTLLGIEEIQNAIEDLDARRDKYNRKFLEAQSNVDEHSELKQELEQIRQAGQPESKKHCQGCWRPGLQG